MIQVPEAGIRLILFFCALTHISQDGLEPDRAMNAIRAHTLGVTDSQVVSRKQQEWHKE